jgi:hypothetical protein
MGYRIEVLPIATPSNKAMENATVAVREVIGLTQKLARASSAMLDWLRHEFDVVKPTRALLAPSGTDADGFVSLVRDALPKRRKLSAADIGELKREFQTTIDPIRPLRGELSSLELCLSDLVNDAYGLTPKETQLMWRTAPPRMPFTQAGPVAGDAVEAADGEGNED